MKKIVIIGGGLAGLAAAYRLADDHQVTIVEAEHTLGGMVQSYHVDDFYIEKFYHHFFSSDDELIQLLEELGLADQVLWLTGSTGYYWEGKAYPMSTPLEILKFPPMSLFHIFRLGLLVLRSRLVRDIRAYDDITAKEWILKIGGQGVYDNFFQPLLRSKFGSNADQVSAAWLLGRVRIRSDRGAKGEKLGYLRGGFHKLVETLAGSIQKKGGRIITGNAALQILMEQDRVTGVKLEQGTLNCDGVISTAAPAVLEALIRPESLDLEPVRYQGTCCALMGLSEPVMREGTYWLNIKADVPFGALIEHTNFMPARDYSGQHLLYMASYFQYPEDQLYTSTPEEVKEMFLRGLEHLYPDFDRGSVLWWELARDARTAPIYETGYAQRILPYKTGVDGLYLAGMFSEANYPERSMNGSIRAGYAAARLV